MNRRLILPLVVPTMLLVAACTAGTSPPAGTTGPPTSPLPILLGPDYPHRAYGITAINYHFHDAHPTRPISSTRTVLWTNAGAVVHNVTIPALGFSEDIPVGGTIRIKALGRKLGGPGRYRFYCAYHTAFGMGGVIVISD